MNDRERLLDDIAALALGVSQLEAARKLRARIALDDELLAEYESMRATADVVGLAADEPPVDDVQRARMKARIMRSVRPQRSEQRRLAGGRPWPAYLVSAAALAAALFAIVEDASLRKQLGDQRQETAILQRDLGRQSDLATAQRRQLADLVAPDSRHYAVKGGEVITRGANVYLAMRALPKLPAGKVFQAWTLARGGKSMAPNVTFTPNGVGSALVSLQPVHGPLAAVAVSVEPVGGSKAPTSTPTFIRPLS